MKGLLTRDKTLIDSIYKLHFIKPITRIFGYTAVLWSSDNFITLHPDQVKKLFGLKRHLRPGSKKILEFEIEVKEIKR